MNDQDRAAQVLRTFPLFVSKLFTQDERQDAISAIAAYGQEQYRAGVEASYEAARKAWPTALRECQANEILDAIYNLLAEQEKK